MTRAAFGSGRLVLLVVGVGLLSRLPTGPLPPHVAALGLLVILLGLPTVLTWGINAWRRSAADTPLLYRLADVALGLICRWSLVTAAVAGLDHGAEVVEAMLSITGDSLLCLTALAAVMLGALFHLAHRLLAFQPRGATRRR